jgi:protein tyrosine phosphatase
MIHRLTKKRNINKSQTNVKSSNAKHQLTKKHITRKSQNRKTKLYKVRKGVKGFKWVKGKKTVQKGGLVCKPPKKGFFKTIFGKKNDPKKQMEECFKTQLLNMIKARDTSKSGFIYLHPYDDLICRLYFDVEINTNPYTYLSPKIVFDEYKYITKFLDILPKNIKTMSRTHTHLKSPEAIRYNFYYWLINYYDFIFKDEKYEDNKLILKKFMKIKFTDESQKTYMHTNNLNSVEFIKHREVVDEFIQKISSDYVEPTSQALSSPTSTPPSPNRHLKPNTNHKDIKHIWFTNWPDHGVPKNMTLFHAFITYVYEDMKKGGNTVIHCSAGIGRTGVVYMVLFLLNNGYIPKLAEIKIKINTISDEKKLNYEELYEAVKLARSYRFGLVQTEEQYNFIYDYFVNKENSNSNPSISTTFTNLTKDCNQDPTKTPTKVRYGNFLPCSKHVVELPLTTTTPTYIHASKMNPLHFGNTIVPIITAECPRQNNENFYTMLDSYDIERIIMVTGLVENEKPKCDNYFNFPDTTTGSDNVKYNDNPITLTKSDKNSNKWGLIHKLSFDEHEQYKTKQSALPNTDIDL